MDLIKNLGSYLATGIYSKEEFTSQDILPTSFEQLFANITETGTYPFWSSVNSRIINVFVLVETQEKKWVLVLRYNHKGGTNPSLKPINDGDFPIPSKSDAAYLLTFADESSTLGWGHVEAKYMAQFSISEVGFFARTSNHERVINFTSKSSGPITFLTGVGAFNAGRCYCTEPGTFFGINETASIPRNAKEFDTKIPITDSPFSIANTAYWSIKSAEYRWQVDDYLLETTSTFDKNTSLYSFDTLHMVFVR
jgi:hypothetical protein